MTAGDEALQLVALARQRMAQGEPGALQALSRALDLSEDPGIRAEAAPAFAALVAEMRPSRWHPRFEADLLVCLGEPSVDPQTLARVVARLLLVKHPKPEIALAGHDPLWTAFLTRCINLLPEMETRLIAMRAILAVEGGHERLTCALALQAFANEYALPPAGIGLLDRPLAKLPDSTSFDDPLWTLLERTRHDLLRESELATAMPALAGGTPNPVSAAVRVQYEASPYPRWQAPPSPRPAVLSDYLATLPGIDRDALPPAPLRMLVAGCGTGFEPIDFARIDPTLAITALDLSRASLAYGRRMGATLGVTNVHFVQGDILDLPASGERFDLISSTGVLHHMERPADGLAALRDVLAPGGVLRIALYSRRARAAVSEAHAFIRAEGLEPTPEGIRTLRAHILSLPADVPLARLRESDDFYSLSGCRDLLFHVHEHSYTLPEIGAMLKEAGLKLVGFDAPSISSGGAPLDLTRWDAIEARHPTLFAGMYQLWCQRD